MMLDNKLHMLRDIDKQFIYVNGIMYYDAHDLIRKMNSLGIKDTVGIYKYMNKDKADIYHWSKDKLNTTKRDDLKTLYLQCKAIYNTANCLVEAMRDAIVYREGGAYPFRDRDIKALPNDDVLTLYMEQYKI